MGARGRHVVREAPRRGHRAPAMVRPLSRQTEDRQLHDESQNPQRHFERRGAAHDRRDCRTLRTRRGRTDHPPEHPASLHHARPLPRDTRPAEARRPDHDGRMRRRGAQYHRMPGRRNRSRRVVRRDRRDFGSGGVLLRQSRVLGPAAQAQDHDRGLPRPVQRTRDQLRRAGWHAEQRPQWFCDFESAADSPRLRASRAISASSSRASRRSRQCARFSTSGG